MLTSEKAIITHSCLWVRLMGFSDANIRNSKLLLAISWANVKCRWMVEQFLLIKVYGKAICLIFQLEDSRMRYMPPVYETKYPGEIMTLYTYMIVHWEGNGYFSICLALKVVMHFI